MANIEVMNLIGPVGVGVISSAGEVIANNRADKKAADPTIKDNIFLDNAGVISDIVAGGYAFINHATDLGFPRAGRGSAETMGAGAAILTRRAVIAIGRQLLSVNGGVGRHSRRLSPGVNSRQYPAFVPGATVEGSTITQRRQFYSRT